MVFLRTSEGDSPGGVLGGLLPRLSEGGSPLGFLRVVLPRVF